MKPEADSCAVLGEIGDSKVSEVPVFHTTDPCVRDAHSTTDVLLMQAPRQTSGTKVSAKLSLESTTVDGSLIDPADPVGHGADSRGWELSPG
jgi:hypothetical protein